MTHLQWPILRMRSLTQLPVLCRTCLPSTVPPSTPSVSRATGVSVGSRFIAMEKTTSRNTGYFSQTCWGLSMIARLPKNFTSPITTTTTTTCKYSSFSCFLIVVIIIYFNYFKIVEYKLFIFKYQKCKDYYYY